MCGIIGIYSDKPVARDLFFGLSTLQHRGQESCGIAVAQKVVKDSMSCHKGMGLVHHVLKPQELHEMSADIGIGHVRYSTAGGSFEYNTQPLLGFSKGKRVALAHNGNLINSQLLRTRLEEEGMMFHTTIDSEVILSLISRYYNDNMLEAIIKTMDMIKGAYSMVVMLNDKLVAVRDPYGFRPLVMGKRGEDYIFASETGAIDVLGGEFIRDLKPGEIVIIKDGELTSHMYQHDAPFSSCIFEHIYFARADATIDSLNAYSFRVKTGELLAEEMPADADIVIPVPDSGWPGAIGFSQKSGIPIIEGLVKNRYVGRSFIKPTQEERDMAVKLKLNPIKSIVTGKKIVLVDDSIVRGTTSKRLIESLFDAGAKEVHMRVTSPPVKNPCYFGIDTPRRKSLIASHCSVEDIRADIGATTLGFISDEGLKKSAGEGFKYCSACFDGRYPIDPCVI